MDRPKIGSIVDTGFTKATFSAKGSSLLIAYHDISSAGDSIIVAEFKNNLWTKENTQKGIRIILVVGRDSKDALSICGRENSELVCHKKAVAQWETFAHPSLSTPISGDFDDEGLFRVIGLIRQGEFDNLYLATLRKNVIESNIIYEDSSRIVDGSLRSLRYNQTSKSFFGLGSRGSFPVRSASLLNLKANGQFDEKQYLWSEGNESLRFYECSASDYAPIFCTNEREKILILKENGDVISSTIENTSVFSSNFPVD